MATSDPQRMLNHTAVPPVVDARLTSDAASTLKWGPSAPPLHPPAASAPTSLSSTHRDPVSTPSQTGRALKLDTRSVPQFEMLVVGCGGGPLETNLSCYLLKPAQTTWSQGCTALEGGSGMGALSRLIERDPEAFEGFGIGEVGREGGGRMAERIWGYINAFVISHAHLDHILGLILTSGASLSPQPLYGTVRTIQNIDKIFDGGIWPKLAGWEKDGTAGRAYLYHDVPASTKERLPLSPGLEFLAFPIAHGMDPSKFHPHSHADGHESSSECYDSTAFFIREIVSGSNREMLFFGDVEPDSISKRPLNLAVWRHAAPKIVSKHLNTIFLECSYPSSQPTERLWGHLSPPFVFEELRVLSQLVVESRIKSGMDAVDATDRPLEGVTLVIIHIKDDILPLPSSTPHPSPLPSRIHRESLTLSPPLPTLPHRRSSSSIPPLSSRRSNSYGSVERRSSGPPVLGTAIVGGGLSGRRDSSYWSSEPEPEPEPETEEVEVEDMVEERVEERIERELNEMEEEEKLGVRFIRAEQGARILF